MAAVLARRSAQNVTDSAETAMVTHGAMVLRDSHAAGSRSLAGSHRHRYANGMTECLAVQHSVW
jgi:hypothetical protein